MIPLIDKLDINTINDTITSINNALSSAPQQSTPAPVSSAGSGLLIWDKLINGNAVTAVTTNGEVTLDANTHGGYEFEFIIYNPTGGLIVPRLYYNNDTTNTNYDFTDAAGAIWGNDAILGVTAGVPTGEEHVIRGTIHISPRGYVSAIHERISQHPTHEANNGVHHKNAAVTNLTRIDVVSSVANGIGRKSRFRLWRRK